METFKDYYRTLRVRPTADDVTIKAAFRRLAERLSQAFRLSTFLSYEKAVEFRYDIRRDVVHTGVYFRTSLLPSPESTPGLTRWKHKGHTVISSRTLPQRSYGTLCSKAPCWARSAWSTAEGR